MGLDRRDERSWQDGLATDVSPAARPRPPSRHAMKTTRSGRIMPAVLLATALFGAATGAQQPAAAPATIANATAPAPAPAARIVAPAQGSGGDVEIEFAQPAVAPDKVGTQTPAERFLAFDPPLPGATLTWRSTRSATLPVAAVIPLAKSVRITLRSGLRDAAGQPVAAVPPVTVAGPAFRITTWTPRWFQQHSRLSRVPRIVLYFNDRVDPAMVARFASFRSKEGLTVPVLATTTSRGEIGRPPVPVGPWAEQRAVPDDGHRPAAFDPATAAQVVESAVTLTPAKALPVGMGWKLVVAPGIANRDAVGPADGVEIAIGDIPNLAVHAVNAVPELDGPRRITINFNKSIDPGKDAQPDWSRFVTVNPATADLQWSVSGHSLIATGKFTLGTNYSVVVHAGFPAADGTTLGGAWSDSRKFLPHDPHLSLPAFDAPQWLDGRGAFTFVAANLESVRVSVKRIAPEFAALALRGYGAYQNDRTDDAFTRIPMATVPGKSVFSKVLPSQVTVDRSERFQFTWDEVGGGRRAPGFYFINVEGTPREQLQDRRPLGGQSVVLLTDIGLAWKRGQAETTLFAFSHATGRPLGGAVVRLFNEDAEPCGETKASPDGLATIADPAARWAVVGVGDDFHCIPLGRSMPTLDMWSFDVSWAWSVPDKPWRELLFFTERPVYQPGETVFLKAIGRMRSPSGLAMPAPDEPAKLRLYDPRGRLTLEKDVRFSANGTHHDALRLPAGSVGWFRIELDFSKPKPAAAAGTPVAEDEAGDAEYDEDGGRGRNQFQTQLLVQEYQPNAFRLTFADAEVRPEGEKVMVPVRAAYLMGKALSKASLTWTSRLSQVTFAPDNWPDFRFGTPQSSYVWDGTQYHQLEEVPWASPLLTGQGTLTLSDKGTAVIEAGKPAAFGVPGPKNLLVEAEITDINQQTIASSWSRTEHPSAFYLGAKYDSRAVAAGDEVPLEIAAVKPDGSRFPDTVKAKVLIEHIVWNAVRLETAGGGTSVRNDPVFVRVSEHEVEVAPREFGGSPFTFRPMTPGTHSLTITATDAAGAEVRTIVRLDVFGAEDARWRRGDGAKIELVADKDRYTPGSTARVLVKSPLKGTALVTVERHKVLWQKVMPLDPGGVVEIPVQEAWAPNVFVSVTHVRGGADDPREVKSPDFRTGFCRLEVNGREDRVHLLVAPSQPEYRPGAQVDVTVTAKDAAGRPLPGTELAVWAVDEGILSLMAWDAPDPWAAFHYQESLSVATGLSLTSLLKEDPKELDFANKGFVVGGGGDEGGLQQPMRKDFRPVAAWHGALVAGPDGTVRISFPAPDNLTEFRVFAVANEGVARFGSAEASFRINKPLMLEPALPRFANAGDEINLKAVVHNTTDKPATVAVDLALDATARLLTGLGGQERDGAATASLEVPAGATRSATFPVRFVKAGPAVFRWKASGGSPALADAVESKLDVGYAEPLLRELRHATLSGAAGDRNFIADIRPEVLEGAGDITVTLANNRLLEAADAVNQLLTYPYGCAEQTMSSLMPWLTLRDLKNVIPALKRTDEEIAGAIQHGVDRLLSMQTETGGLGYWPGAQETNSWASAHGAVGLVLASRVGAVVPPARLDALLTWLSKDLRDKAESGDSWVLATQCYTLWSLALAGRPEPSYHERLFNDRARLQASARAVLALAVAEANGPPDMTRTLLTMTEAQPVHWWLGAESTMAIRSLAWLKLGAPEAQQEIGRLMEARSPRGDWRHTFNNGWVLLALSREAASVKAWDAPKSCIVACGDKRQEITLPKEPGSQSFTFPRSAGTALPSLTITSPAGALIFARIEVTGRGRPGPQPERNAGLGIAKSWQKITTDGSLAPADSLRTGDLVLVSLAIDVPRAIDYLVIDDPLPATMEGVNPNFTSMAAASRDVAATAWSVNHTEMRRDRVLFFRDYSPGAGRFRCQYLARVVAAGSVTMPAARIEAMYDPATFGLSPSQRLTTSPSGDDDVAER